MKRILKALKIECVSYSEALVLIWFGMLDAVVSFIPKRFHTFRCNILKLKMSRVCCYHPEVKVPIGFRSAFLLVLFSRTNRIRHPHVTFGICPSCVKDQMHDVVPEPTIQDTIHQPMQNGKYRRDTAMDIALRWLTSRAPL